MTRLVAEGRRLRGAAVSSVNSIESSHEFTRALFAARRARTRPVGGRGAGDGDASCRSVGKVYMLTDFVILYRHKVNFGPLFPR
jgi:hypothetical protein